MKKRFFVGMLAMGLAVSAVVVLAGCASTDTPVKSEQGLTESARHGAAVNPNNRDNAAPAASVPSAPVAPVAAPVLVASGALSLDAVIAQAARRMEERLPGGTKVAIVSVASPSTAFSGYVIDSLEGALVDKGTLKVVDRANLDKIRAEQGFQLSGEVSDASAKSIGQMLGAGAIVTGSLLNIGEEHRLTLKAINIESAEVAVSYPADIIGDSRVKALLASGGGSSAAPATVTAGRPVSSGAAAPVAQAAAPGVAPVQTSPVVPATSAPSAMPTAVYNATASYAANNAESFANAIKAINANTTDDSTFVIVLSGSFASDAVTFSTNAFKTITIRGDAVNRTLSNNSEKTLFTVPTGITLVLDNNATLDGNDKERSAVEILVGGQFIMKEGSTVTGAKSSSININSGIFTMNGGTITRNNRGVYVQNNGKVTMTGGSITGNTTQESSGGGVYINSGSFTMTGGTIIRNTANINNGLGGGGVYVEGGTFTMNGGTIRGNTVSYRGSDSCGGGGVYVRGGTFTMTDGTITGNTTADYGGGVYVFIGTFVKTGGTIDDTNVGQGGGAVAYVAFNNYRRNTTAGPKDKMDNRKSGEAGGWE